jgi:TatD DNase family protein
MHNYIVDTHCHLDLIEENGINIDEILLNCANNNVKILQTICTKISNINKLLNYTKTYENIYCSVGIHPCNVADEDKITHEEIVNYCNSNEKIIGIGETGLDYFHDLTHIELQKIIFEEHIIASQKTNIPIIIHSRNADIDMAEMLKFHQKNQQFNGLLHCFSSSYDLAKTALDLGMYISIAGIVTFKNAIDLQEIVKKIPLEFLLIETDSPYLAPVPFRGKTNQPAFCLHVAKHIAELKNIDISQVINQTTENFYKIFKKVNKNKL